MAEVRKGYDGRQFPGPYPESLSVLEAQYDDALPHPNLEWMEAEVNGTASQPSDCVALWTSDGALSTQKLQDVPIGALSAIKAPLSPLSLGLEPNLEAALEPLGSPVAIFSQSFEAAKLDRRFQPGRKLFADEPSPAQPGSPSRFVEWQPAS